MTFHPDVRAARVLAADLADIGATAEALRAAWGTVADDAFGRGLRYPALRSLGDRDDPLATIGRLFVLGCDAPVSQVNAALPRSGVDGLVQLGIAERHGDVCHPTAIIRPQDFQDEAGTAHWWIASDLDEIVLGHALPENHVLGVGGASLTLAGLQLPGRVRRALDLGTGCGVQAIRARRYAEQVIATDVSERALAYAELNAELCGVSGIELRQGSMFEPVAGETFDRVVSNLPFVITPRADGVPSYEYRDGGQVGDALVAGFVRSVGDHLAPGGIAVALGNWETRGDRSGLDRVREWVAESSVPLDAWVIEREALDPERYAELWVRDGGTSSADPRHDELLTAWLDDFASRDVSEIGLGYLILRRPAAGAVTLERFERIPGAIADGVGPHLAQCLAAADDVAEGGTDALLTTHFTVAPDVTEARHYTPGAADPSVIELHQGGGFRRTVPVDPALAAVVGACDGELALGVLIDAVAQLLDVPVGALRDDLAPRVRDLVETGFLVPEPAPPRR